MQNTPLYSEVFPSLIRVYREWSIWWPAGFFYNLLYETTALALQGVIGVLFLRMFYRLPPILEITCGIFMGIGLVTFPLMIAAIFFFLNQMTVIITLVLLVIILVAINEIYVENPLKIKIEAEKLVESWEKWIFRLAWCILAVITFLSFYHGLLYPVSYWDSLIYYVHYGKMTYEQGGFPVLYCLQVGLGLGANYPHLFALHQAATAALFNHWSDIYAQFLSPLAGLGSLIILYYLALFLFRNRVSAILSVLAYRSVTFVTAYFIWTSDYALVMAYTALFLLFLAIFLNNPFWHGIHPLLCVSAIFPNINYLGWIVWPCVVAAAICWWYSRRPVSPLYKSIILPFLGWFILGIIWYVRNYWVTGNPVYAFFPEIFGGKNINLEVLRSCEKEWFSHGNGVQGLGSTLWERIIHTPRFLLTDWRPAPLTAGLFIPALFVGWKEQKQFFGISALLLLFYVFYEYCISGLYLYHIIAIVPIFAVFTARLLANVPVKRMQAYFGLLIIVAGVVPGISYSLMGSKYPDLHLALLSHPGIPKELYYQYVYPGVTSAWKYMDASLEPNSLVLSHENRYHVLRPDIRIIHLDDCGLTPLYGKPYPEVHKELLQRGVKYYFYIPDEDTHPITLRLGHRAYLNDPKFFEKVFEKKYKEEDKGKEKVVQIYRLK